MEFHKIYKIVFIFGFIYLNFISVNPVSSQSGWISQTLGTRKYVNVNFINSTSGFLIGSDGKILKTTNLGTNWNIYSDNNFGTTLINGFVYNDSKSMVIAGGLSGGMVYSTIDSGSHWINGGDEILPVGNGIIGLRGLKIVNNLVAYVCGFDFGTNDHISYLDGIIYKTTNSGVNWFQSFRGGIDYYDIKFKDSLTGYCNRYDIIKTTNGGNSWEYNGSIGDFTYSLSNIFNDTMYTCGDSGKVFRSINGGVNWTKFYTPANDTLKRIYFLDSKIGYAIGVAGKIVKTTNAGINWTLQISGTTRNLNSIWFINKDTGFVVGDNGVVLKTFSGGVLVNILSNSKSIPDNYFLSQNYPNPFNPATKIIYELPASRQGGRVMNYVLLKVYDVLGNEVKTLVNENKTAGSYEVEFDGSNLPSGVYYYTIKAGNFKQIRKMVLIK
jgi:photosystem II stability/assembly factor-like uncharacterized protein